MQVYEVGGTVRDRIMGVDNTDRDYTVVIESLAGQSAAIGYVEMQAALSALGYKFFQNNADVMTVRAKFPVGHVHEGQTADFVLARKETYTAGSRRPTVVVGTLFDDIMRRDFTVNALSVDNDGNIIDIVGGIADIEKRILRTVWDVDKVFTDDPLRALRAIRFSITKGFRLHEDIVNYFKHEAISLIAKTEATVSAERIREELTKAFKFDTVATFKALSSMDSRLMEYWITAGFKGMWLMPTFKK